MTASHPETPPGHPSINIIHHHWLHPGFPLRPRLRRTSNPCVKLMEQQHITRGQGVRASLGRLAAAARPVLAQQAVCESGCSGVLLLQQRQKRYCTSLRRSPVPFPYKMECPTGGKMSPRNAAFCICYPKNGGQGGVN